MQQKNNVIGLGVVVMVLFFLFFYRFPWNSEPADRAQTDIRPALEIESQPPGEFIIVKKALLPDGGYIVAHQDIGGLPGSVRGYSAYLRPGLNTSMVIVMDTPATVGQSLLITLYGDNGDFQLTGEDEPLVDSSGKTITKQLVIVNEDLLKAR